MAKLNSYKGSVELISGLKQKNDQDFPLAQAHDIQVAEDGTRLDAKLEYMRQEYLNIDADNVTVSSAVYPDGDELGDLGQVLVDINNRLTAAETDDGSSSGDIVASGTVPVAASAWVSNGGGTILTADVVIEELIELEQGTVTLLMPEDQNTRTYAKKSGLYVINVSDPCVVTLACPASNSSYIQNFTFRYVVFATGGTHSNVINLVGVDVAGGNTNNTTGGDSASTDIDISSAIGTTYPPAQRSAEPKYDDCEEDMPNIHEATADDIHTYIDNVVSGKPTVTKEIMGKDSSGKYDIARYIYAKREHLAWVKENYPKMYAWKNGSTVKYTTSVAPRKQDSAYDVPYIKKGGTTTETVTVPALAILYKGYRWSMSGGGFKADSTYTSLILPLPVGGVTTAVVSFTGITGSTSAGYGGTTNTSFTSQICSGDPWTYPALQTFTAGDSTYSLSGLKFLTIPLKAQADYSNITITMNGEVVNYKVGDPSEAKQASTTTTEVESDGDAGVPVTAVSATRRSRTVGGVEYVRYEAGDVEPTVIYTDRDDDRNSETSITKDGVTYSRYPLGDLGANRKKLLPIVIWANVHGTPKVIPDTITKETVATVVETKMCALIAARVMRDLAAEKQLNNPLYKFIRENCMVIVIPVANPYGFNCNVTSDSAPYSGYFNANNCNINRNHDTPGWDYMLANGQTQMVMGQYPASENETQYLDNTMVESGAVVAMSLHGGDRLDKYCLHQGQNPSPNGTGYVEYDADKLDAIGTFLNENYGYTLKYYDEIEGLTTRVNNTPDKTSKDPSFISQCGAYGGILELAVNDPDVSGNERAIRGKVVEAAYAQVINFTAMWLDDYLSTT